jgi:hypothetical protein
MAWPLIAAMAGQELAKGGIRYLTRPKPKRAEETATGRLLMRRSSEGAYGPNVRRNILNTAGRASAAAEQTQTSAIRGGLVRSGMNDSIAGQSLLAQPGLRRAGQMGEVGERLEAANEESKMSARGDFAALSDQQDEAGRESKRQALAGLLGSGVNAAQAGIGAYQEEKTFGELDDFNKKYAQADLLIQAGRFDEAQRIIEELTGGGGMGEAPPMGAGLRRPMAQPQNRVMQMGRY